MQCPNCGHPDSSHNDAGCFHDDGVPCLCMTSGEEIRFPEQYHQRPSMKAWYRGREISITDMSNGKFCFETDRDESGYVTAASIDDAWLQIKSIVQKHDAYQQDAPGTCSQGYDMSDGGKQ